MTLSAGRGRAARRWRRRARSRPRRPAGGSRPGVRRARPPSAWGRKRKRLVLVESLARGVSVVQLVFGLSNPRKSANFPLVKPKIRARIGQNVCPIRGEFAAGERFHQGHPKRWWDLLDERRVHVRAAPALLHGLLVAGQELRREVAPARAVVDLLQHLRKTIKTDCVISN